MSAHFAQQSSDEAACAVMSEHLAQGSQRRIAIRPFRHS